VSVQETRLSDPPIGAADGIIDILVTPGASDLRALTRLDPWRGFHLVTTILARTGAGALAAGATAIFVWVGDPDQSSLGVLTAALAGGLVGIAAFRFAMERAWKQRIARDLIGAPFRFRSDGERLSLADDTLARALPLAAIDRVAETRTHLILFLRGTPFLALPRSAFPTPDDAVAFARFLSRKIATHPPLKETPP
jgi:hypothetical protein